MTRAVCMAARRYPSPPLRRNRWASGSSGKTRHGARPSRPTGSCSSDTADPVVDSGRHTGRTDIPLTEEGTAQADRLAAGARRTAVRARAHQPPVARPRDGPAGRVRRSSEQSDDLVEWDYGEDEGRTTAADPRAEAGLDMWNDPCPGGETVDQVADRADRVLARARAAGAMSCSSPTPTCCGCSSPAGSGSAPPTAACSARSGHRLRARLRTDPARGGDVERRCRRVDAARYVTRTAARASSMVNAAVVERAADDDAGQPPAVRPRAPPACGGVRHDPTPPEAMTSAAPAPAGRRRPADRVRCRRRRRRSAVTISAANPASSNSTATSTRSRPDPSTQPRTATSRPRPSSPSATRPGQRSPTGGPTPGRSSAAVPTTTRVTPPSRSASAAVVVAHATAGLHPGADRAAAIAAITGRFTGSPVRAASRSTTWIHRRPGVGEQPRLRHRVVAVHRLLVEVALVEAHAPPAAQVDRRVQLHHRLGHRHWSTKLAEQVRRPVGARLLGVELGGPQRCPARPWR